VDMTSRSPSKSPSKSPPESPHMAVSSDRAKVSFLLPAGKSRLLTLPVQVRTGRKVDDRAVVDGAVFSAPDSPEPDKDDETADEEDNVDSTMDSSLVSLSIPPKTPRSVVVEDLTKTPKRSTTTSSMDFYFRCLRCGEKTLEQAQMFEHVRYKHLGREAKFNDVVKEENGHMTYPARAFMCKIRCGVCKAASFLGHRSNVLKDALAHARRDHSAAVSMAPARLEYRCRGCQALAFEVKKLVRYVR